MCIRHICTLPLTVCPLSGCRNSCLGVPPGFLNPDPISDQNFIFHTRFQTWSQKSMPDFRPKSLGKAGPATSQAE